VTAQQIGVPLYLLEFTRLNTSSEIKSVMNYDGIMRMLIEND